MAGMKTLKGIRESPEKIAIKVKHLRVPDVFRRADLARSNLCCQLSSSKCQLEDPFAERVTVALSLIKKDAFESSIAFHIR